MTHRLFVYGSLRKGFHHPAYQYISGHFDFIGPATVKSIVDVLEKSRTVLWNGPLGAFEVPPFDQAACGFQKPRPPRP